MTSKYNIEQVSKPPFKLTGYSTPDDMQGTFYTGAVEATSGGKFDCLPEYTAAAGEGGSCSAKPKVSKLQTCKALCDGNQKCFGFNFIFNEYNKKFIGETGNDGGVCIFFNADPTSSGVKKEKCASWEGSEPLCVNPGTDRNWNCCSEGYFYKKADAKACNGDGCAADGKPIQPIDETPAECQAWCTTLEKSWRNKCKMAKCAGCTHCHTEFKEDKKKEVGKKQECPPPSIQAPDGASAVPECAAGCKCFECTGTCDAAKYRSDAGYATTAHYDWATEHGVPTTGTPPASPQTAAAAAPAAESIVAAADTAAKQTAEEPSEEPTQEPTEEPTQEPAEEPTQEPAEEPAPAPAQTPAPAPVQTPSEEPAEEPAEEPVEEPAPTPAPAAAEIDPLADNSPDR
jgi:hypothetical protein